MPKHKNDWADAAARICLKFLTTGNVIWLVGAMIILSLIWKMNSDDLKDCVISFIGWPWFGVTGWILFIFTLLIGKAVLRLQQADYRREIERMAKVRDQAMQPSLELEMRSSKD